MMSDNDFIEFVKRYSNYFKEFTIDIPIFDKDYSFNIVLITSTKIKIQYLFSYENIFRSLENTIEFMLKEIILEDDRNVISSSFVLGQRARNRRNLNNMNFTASVYGNDEEFKINNVSQNGVTIQKILNFSDFENSDDFSIQNIVKIQLISFKPLVDSKIQFKELEQLEKQERRLEKLNEIGNKNESYSESSLMSRALLKKYALKNTCYSTKVYGKVCSFDINGVGPQAVKLGKCFDVFDIYYSEQNSIEGKIKSFIDEQLDESYSDIDEFKVRLNQYWFSSRFNVKIGESINLFDIQISSEEIKLEIYVRYSQMWSQSLLEEDCLETGLKKYIENFRYVKK